MTATRPAIHNLPMDVVLAGIYINAAGNSHTTDETFSGASSDPWRRYHTPDAGSGDILNGGRMTHQEMLYTVNGKVLFTI